MMTTNSKKPPIVEVAKIAAGFDATRVPAYDEVCVPSWNVSGRLLSTDNIKMLINKKQHWGPQFEGKGFGIKHSLLIFCSSWNCFSTCSRISRSRSSWFTSSARSSATKECILLANRLVVRRGGWAHQNTKLPCCSNCFTCNLNSYHRVHRQRLQYKVYTASDLYGH